MGQNDDLCPDCKKTASPHHTLTGFDTELNPVIECGRDPALGPDRNLEGFNHLYLRVEASETALAKARTDYDDKARELQAELAKSAGLEMGIAQLQTSRSKAVADAVKEVEDLMGADLAKAQKSLEQLDASCKRQLKDLREQLTFKEGRLAETEAANAELRQAKADLETRLRATEIVARDARTEAVSAAAQRDAIAESLKVRNEEFRLLGRGNLSQATRIGLLEERLERYAALYGALPAEAIEAQPDNGIIELTEPKRASAAAPSVSAAPKATPPPPPMPVVVTPPAPAPVPSSPSPTTAVECMCCDAAATKIATGKLRLKGGGFAKDLISCDNLDDHIIDFYVNVQGIADKLENPPRSPSDLQQLFEDLNP